MITILYAAVLAIIYLFLTARVIFARNALRIGIGDGGDTSLSRLIRVHGDFAEFVPFALLLIFLTDYAGYPPIIIHALGIMLVMGRILHAWGLGGSIGSSPGRVGGVVLTLLVFAVCAVLLLWKFYALRLIGF